jgi:hypothetical protein
VFDRLLLAQLLEAADLAYAAYKVNPQSACAVSHLRVRRVCNLCRFDVMLCTLVSQALVCR